MNFDRFWAQICHCATLSFFSCSMMVDEHITLN